MEFKLVGGSYDGESIDLPADRFGNTDSQLSLPRRKTLSQGREELLANMPQTPEYFEVYVKTPHGVNPDGSTKFVYWKR
ncbi:hypothetical protein ABK735_15170 [Enterobacter kobei]|uniref:hypothetical protein n=1 Tax=Enterobacter cloacae complex TaxID=354276 RepID=UPI0007353EFB|nr:hypothetical protein [Enterobacter cloacae]KTH70931.1 hypothetical protein ASV19_17930 [Enterobacter cloacae subsp. cloacae]HBN6007498.1 hypothetical protein [Enterobacter cloacae]HEG2118798.1 hypothetical protein [Enterobacter kobei]HEG2199306.1 hypothetical protein [Enterobacter kobei]